MTTDLTEHPFFIFCDQACIAPDTGRSDAYLAERWEKETGQTITTEEVCAMRADFWDAVDSAPAVSLGTFRL